VADLERSVGDKLAALLGSDDRLVTAADIDGVLEEIGAVDTGRDPAADEDAEMRPRSRKLRRIKEGQWLAGVCNGLAAYADLPVDWVRTGFLVATTLTAGIFGLVYVALAFVLPVDATREARDVKRR
jgi:phage shock protein C